MSEITRPAKEFTSKIMCSTYPQTASSHIRGLIGLVESLQSQLKALQEDREWVSVEDRLPDVCDEYRIYPCVELQNYHSEAEYSPRENKWTVKEYESWGENIFNPKPTHWMPLPTPPNTKGGGE